MAKDGISQDEIIKLISELREETTEYPADMLEERKYSFIKQMVDANISMRSSRADTKPQQTKSSVRKTGSSGSSSRSKALGTAVGSGSTATGISLKTLLAIGAVVVLLTAAYLFRDRIEKALRDNNLIPTEETTSPLLVPNPVRQATPTPTQGPFPTYGPPSGGSTQPGSGGGNSVNPFGTPASGDNSGRPGLFPGNGSGSGSGSGSGIGAGPGGQKTPTPTPPSQSGPTNVFQFLICILQTGSGDCR